MRARKIDDNRTPCHLVACNSIPTFTFFFIFLRERAGVSAPMGFTDLIYRHGTAVGKKGKRRHVSLSHTQVSQIDFSRNYTLLLVSRSPVYARFPVSDLSLPYVVLPFYVPGKLPRTSSLSHARFRLRRRSTKIRLYNPPYPFPHRNNCYNSDLVLIAANFPTLPISSSPPLIVSHKTRAVCNEKMLPVRPRAHAYSLLFSLGTR